MTGSLTSGDWVAVTLAYIGSQALVDLAAQWKHGSKMLLKLKIAYQLAKKYWKASFDCLDNSCLAVF